MPAYTSYKKGDCVRQDKPKALVACEYSRTLANRLERIGFYTVSCDILDADTEGLHYKGDVFDILDDGWDLMVAHPPCTYLSVSGNAWLYHPDDKHLPKNERRDHPNHPKRREKAKEAAEFAKSLYDANIKYVAIENPVSRLATLWRKSDQTVQPYQFGDDAEKATSYWLKNLPRLEPTKIITPTKHTTKSGKTYSTWWWETCKLPSHNGARAHARNKSFPGISDAITNQWGLYVLEKLSPKSNTCSIFPN